MMHILIGKSDFLYEGGILWKIANQAAVTMVLAAIIYVRERGFGFPTESVQNKNFWEDSICVNPQTEDGCQPESNCPGLPLAAAYVPMQPFTGLVGPDEALERGSSFDNLYIPYKKGGCA